MGPSCFSKKVNLPVTACATEESPSPVMKCKKERDDSPGFAVLIASELLCLHLFPLCQCWVV